MSVEIQLLVNDESRIKVFIEALGHTWLLAL